jgi:predicted patatin/cPLA2 family phospholipase
VYKNFPKLQETISSRYRVYNETLDYIESLEEQGEVFVIRPRRKVEIDRMERNKSKLADFYKTGYEDAHDIWADLSDWMSKIK